MEQWITGSPDGAVPFLRFLSPPPASPAKEALSETACREASRYMKIKEKNAPFTTHKLFSHYKDTAKFKDKDEGL